jgi:predicted secreted Zn-dependent protease
MTISIERVSGRLFLSFRRLLILAPLVLSACTTSSVTTDFYDIKGNTEKALDRSIRLNSPQNGEAFAAIEVRLVPVEIKPVVDPVGCRIGTAKIKVEARIILPRWKDRNGASSELKRGFDIYAAYAKEHENVHLRIAEQAAKALENDLKAIPSQKNCDVTLQKSKRVVRSLLARHNRVQLAFDASEKRRIAKLLRDASRTRS